MLKSGENNLFVKYVSAECFEFVEGNMMKVRVSMIDRELRAQGIFLKIFNNTFSIPKLRLLNLLLKKKKWKYRNDNIEVIYHQVPRKDGTMMRVCAYMPKEQKENLPGIMWLHGGGYAIGAPEQCSAMAEKLIEASRCIVISPDYRLSFEAPYPAALDDAYDTLLWMKHNAGRLGIRSEQLMVGGESAGGGLAVALSMYARDRGEVAIAFLMPLYPMLDDRMNSYSAKENNAPLWNSKSTRNCWKLYLGELSGASVVPCYASPARAKDYSGLPPATTFVGELEPFRDETAVYVENLRNAGIAVDFEIYPGCYHGFDVVCPGADISKRATGKLLDSYKYAVQHYFKKQQSDSSEMISKSASH